MRLGQALATCLALDRRAGVPERSVSEASCQGSPEPNLCNDLVLKTRRSEPKSVAEAERGGVNFLWGRRGKIKKQQNRELRTASVSDAVRFR